MHEFIVLLKKGDLVILKYAYIHKMEELKRDTVKSLSADEVDVFDVEAHSFDAYVT